MRSVDPLEVPHHSERAAIAVSRILFEQPGDEIVYDAWDGVPKLRHSSGGHCKMIVDQLQRLRARERRSSSRHLEKRDAKRVQVRSEVNGPAGAARLLWRDVGERTEHQTRRERCCLLPRHDGGNAEVDDANRSAIFADHDAAWLDVAMDDVVPVKLGDSRCDPFGYGDRLPNRQGAILEKAPERRAAIVR